MSGFKTTLEMSLDGVLHSRTEGLLEDDNANVDMMLGLCIGHHAVVPRAERPRWKRVMFGPGRIIFEFTTEMLESKLRRETRGPDPW